MFQPITTRHAHSKHKITTKKRTTTKKNTDLLPEENLDQYVEYKHCDIAQDFPKLSCHEYEEDTLTVRTFLTAGDIAPCRHGNVRITQVPSRQDWNSNDQGQSPSQHVAKGEKFLRP